MEIPNFCCLLKYYYSTQTKECVLRGTRVAVLRGTRVGKVTDM